MFERIDPVKRVTIVGPLMTADEFLAEVDSLYEKELYGFHNIPLWHILWGMRLPKPTSVMGRAMGIACLSLFCLVLCRLLV